MKFENIIIEILILLVNDLPCVVRNKCGHVSHVNLKEMYILSTIYYFTVLILSMLLCPRG